MIIVLKANTPKEEAKKLVDAIKAKGLLAKELTQMLNGIIIINDTAGGGATFTVKFPLK